MYTIDFLISPTATQVEQIITLYRQEKWWWEDRQAADIATSIINNSHCFVIALHDTKIIGMGRAISDGVSDAYIQDVVVEKQYQGHGIGRRIIAKILDRIKNDKLEWIGLIAEKGSHPFYEKLGFSMMNNSSPMIYTKK